MVMLLLYIIYIWHY